MEDIYSIKKVISCLTSLIPHRIKPPARLILQCNGDKTPRNPNRTRCKELIPHSHRWMGFRKGSPAGKRQRGVETGEREHADRKAAPWLRASAWLTAPIAAVRGQGRGSFPEGLRGCTRRVGDFPHSSGHPRHPKVGRRMGNDPGNRPHGEQLAIARK
jgi:hypothetical protein